MFGSMRNSIDFGREALVKTWSLYVSLQLSHCRPWPVEPLPMIPSYALRSKVPNTTVPLNRLDNTTLLGQVRIRVHLDAPLKTVLLGRHWHCFLHK